MIFKTLEDLTGALREKLNETQREGGSVRAVSRATGISVPHLNHFKNEKRNLSFENLDLLARHYGVRYNLKNY